MKESIPLDGRFGGFPNSKRLSQAKKIAAEPYGPAARKWSGTRAS